MSANSSLQLDATTTALIFIDLQNAIVGIPRLAPYSGQQVVERANQLAQTFREKRSLVVWVHVAMSETLTLPVDSPMRDPNAPPPPPEASDFVSQLQREPSDIVVLKRQWGAFYGTNLDQHLRRRRIRTIALGGIATNFGVESTARAAYDRGYEVVFVEDAMSTMSADAQKFATTFTFPRMGRVRTTEAVLNALKAGSHTSVR